MTDKSSTARPPIERIPEEIEVLASELESLFSQGLELRWGDEEFEELALRAFEAQFQHNPVYRRFCERRGTVPATVLSWRNVPMVPTTAFRHLDLVTGDRSAVEAVFRTGGTTNSTTAPGRHLASRLSLYRASLLSTFRAHLLST